MNARARRLAILGGLTLLVGSLVLQKMFGDAINTFASLWIPLILLAGFWEGVWGALVVTLVFTLPLPLGVILGWFSSHKAGVDLLSAGITCGVVIVYQLMQEARQQEHGVVVAPLEAKLAKVERKARLIRHQIEEYELRLKGLTQLYESVKKLMLHLELPLLMDEARTIVAKTLTAHFGPPSEEEARLGFYVPEDASGDLVRYSAHDHEVSDEGLPERLPAVDLQHWLGETFGPLKIKDLNTEERFSALKLAPAFQSMILVPLVMHEILIGLMLVASSRVGAFSATEFNQAGVLGKQIVFALRKALLYRKVQTLSITDNLTGLYVHRYFQERLREEMHRAERYRHFLSLILIDLDHFKRVNDTRGHVDGDAVLAETAARLKEAAGPAALVARYGGEEFAVLLPHASKAQGMKAAAVLNSLLKSIPIDLGGEHLTVTLSAGVATYPEDALTREALIAAADSALYTAKRNGRDQVTGYTKQMKLKEKNH
jgi:diguanylate cyclase (GGDEF)-like protein